MTSQWVLQQGNDLKHPLKAGCGVDKHAFHAFWNGILKPQNHSKYVSYAWKSNLRGMTELYQVFLED